VSGLSKAEWRQDLRARRKALSVNHRAVANEAITCKVLGDPAVVGAKCVHVYLSTSVEVSTDEIIRVLIDREIRVIAPWMLSDGSMSATQLIDDDLASLTRASPLGIPSVAVLRAVDLAAIEVVLVPLVGFDSANHRIGMGAGHYDRFLANHPTVPTIGLAYECQRVDEVPTEPHDIALTRVITER
jgi:5-formyltetrahydrofolate cyclo-ligase